VQRKPEEAATIKLNCT